MKNRKTLLSTLWIFATLNYLYCDLIGVMDAEMLNQLLTGTVGDLELSQGFLLGAAILMEIPIAMVLLSRILAYKPNRVLNIIAGAIMTLVQVGSLLMDTPTMYYLFFSMIEMGTTIFIVWTSAKWKKED